MRLFLVIIGFSFAFGLSAQDSTYVRQQINRLAGPDFQGRGYTFDGAKKAAAYLAHELQKIGVEPLTTGYLQEFTLSVNTFPGAMSLKVNGVELRPGIDYLVHPNSQGVTRTFETLKLKPKWLHKEEKTFDLRHGGTDGKILLLDGTKYQDEQFHAFVGSAAENSLNAPAIAVISDDKLTWGIGRKEMDFPLFQVKKQAWPKKARSVEIELENKFSPSMTAYNVAGFIPGEIADSFLVFTAHYDHLGNLGKDTYIAGANDNASGTAMLLDLARHYSKNKPRYSIAFIFFGAEEAGLVGSYHYVDNPLFPLEQISFLVNLDLVGDAGKGITAVNGKIYPTRFQLLQEINFRDQLLDDISARGPAANSDHHPFYEKGVPGFFIYTRGDYAHYHDVHDIPSNLPLIKYTKLFHLITGFADRLQQ